MSYWRVINQNIPRRKLPGPPDPGLIKVKLNDLRKLWNESNQ